ncbi:hypothetical protein RBU60_10470 [Mesonia sp. MT50]|uniref:Spondin domain-containing protein n=1 Tax=Mesonia profundi TaxID=3070998 RepID=A0ABU1A2U1_9FLAO|nr:hypothetical protein [Mesonia profundi]MDQ7918001.1 hypothetical protein [Mesonia profundi]
MMNKKIYSLFFGIICSLQLYAQNLTFEYQSSQNYLQINSYSGNTAEHAYVVKFTANTSSLNVPFWKISVRLAQPITNGNLTFPANKISLQPTGTEGQTVPGSIPTIGQIGMPSNVTLQEGSEVFLVPQSNAPLYVNTTQSGYYFNFHLKFRMVVEGGAYLAQFPAWTDFYANLIFTAYDQHNAIIGTIEPGPWNFQIGNITGTIPTPTPQFSIAIDGSASNALLEFKTKSDYINGVSVSYPNALVVNANTDYQVRVKSIYGSFTSYNDALPLDIIQLHLTPSNDNTATVYPIWLSTNHQKIASGNSTQGAPTFFDINYASKSNDADLITSQSGQYSTTLVYEITPL